MNNNAPLILLVEDDLVLLNLNKHVLTRQGCRVLPVRSFKEAWEAVEKETPQAVVLDVDLPDGRGFDFCRELHERKCRNGESHKIHTIFLTSLCGVQHEKAGYDAGADDYIVKPYSLERLMESLGGLLEQPNEELK